MPIDSADQQVAKKSRSASRVVTNVISNWGAYFIAIAINFFLSPYIVRHLGNTGYGVWTLILSLTGYLGLLDLGVRGAVTRYVAKFHTEANHNSASKVASSALVIFGTAGIVAILTSVVFGLFVINRMHVPPQYLSAARIVLFLTGLNIAISLINGVFGGILVGLQRFDLTNAIEAAINVLRALAIVVALHYGRGIISLAIIQLGFTLIRWGVNFGLARYLYPQLRIRRSAVDQSGIQLIFSFSVFSFLLHVSGSLIYASDNVVIGAYLPVTAITFYVIAGNLVEYARVLVSGITQTLTPLASSMEAEHGPKRIEQLVLSSSRWAAMAILPVTCTFILRGKTFIGLWMGQQYAPLSGQVLIILSISILFWAGNSAVAGIMLGLSKHKPIVPATLTEGFLNLALSIFLVRKIGIVGVAWGTSLPNLLSSLIFWPWYVRRALGIPILNYMISCLLRPWIGIIPFVAVTFCIESLWPTDSLLLFFSQVALALPLAGVGYWFFCLDSDQRERFGRKASLWFEQGWRTKILSVKP